MVTMFQTLAGTELGFGDSLKYTAIGIIMVFAVLAILIVLIEALHAAFKEKKTAPQPQQPVEQAKQPEKRISAGVMAEVPEAVDAEKDEEFIAAVSSVITSVTGNGNFKIKSIKKG